MKGVVESEHSRDTACGQRPDPFTALATVTRGCLASVLGDMREYLSGISGEDTHEIETARTELNKVIAPSPGILFPADAEVD